MKTGGVKCVPIAYRVANPHLGDKLIVGNQVEAGKHHLALNGRELHPRAAGADPFLGIRDPRGAASPRFVLEGRPQRAAPRGLGPRRLLDPRAEARRSAASAMPSRPAPLGRDDLLALKWDRVYAPQAAIYRDALRPILASLHPGTDAERSSSRSARRLGRHRGAPIAASAEHAECRMT